MRARVAVEGFIKGIHRSPYHGFSVEFSEYREYSPGDDPRYLDWKLYARSDRYYIKQYEAETNLRCTVVVDVSESMHYGRGPLNKYEYACTIGACLAYLLTRDRLDLGTWGTWPGYPLGLLGAWLAMFADLLVRGSFFLARFAGGRWQTLRV